MSSGKSGSGSKDYFGHLFGILCQGRLDFISGILIDNELVWPEAKLWDSSLFKKNTLLIWTDGNVYRALEKTNIDPPTFPWSLFAVPYVVGTYNLGDGILSAGNVWESSHNGNVAAPPAAPPTGIGVERELALNGWIYRGTPALWATVSADPFWEANSIVAWKGKLYTTNADTDEEPPTAPWTEFKILRTDSPNPLKITIPHHGDAYLYWGTSDQVLSAEEGILLALGHPPYRYRAGLMLKNFKLGTMKVTAPEILAVCGRAPEQTLIVGDAAELDTDDQANPWCVFAELLTHPVIGLGLPATWFDADSWQAEADACLARSDLTYISPMITTLQKIRELASNLLDVPDAFVFWSTIATLTAGHWPHGEAAPVFTDETTIDRNDLTAPRSWTSDGWDGTASSARLSYRDIEAGFTNQPLIAPNLFNAAVTRRNQSQTFDRPHVVRFAQAAALAAEAAKIAGEQLYKGTHTVRAEKATSITPGSLFLFNDDQLGIAHVQRCTKKVISAPPIGTAKLSFENERGLSPQPYSPTPIDKQPDQGPPPGPVVNAMFVQLPTALATEANSIACLAARDNKYTSAIDIWFQQADAAAFQRLGRQTGFSIAGLFNQSSTGTTAYLLTDNSGLGVTYNAPANTTLLDAALTYIPPGGALTAGVYGTDYTYNLFTGVVTIPLTSNIPLHSSVILTAFDGTVATTSATVGNTYNIPKNFWSFNVWSRAAGAAYTGGFSGSTHRNEGTDYLIDPVAGTITVLAGGGIAATDAVYILYADSVRVSLSDSTTSEDIELISAPPTEDEINNGEILLFAFQAANPLKYEIMSVTSVTAAVATYPALASAGYRIGIVRQQFGTLYGGDGAHDWTTNDIVFIVRRSALSSFFHESFPGLAQSGSTAQFIIAPESAWVIADITDLYDLANNTEGLSTQYSYTFGNTLVPTVTWIQQLQNGAVIASFAGAFLTTDVFRFAFQANAPAGAKIANASLVAQIGEQQLTLWSQNFAPTSQQNCAVEFSLANPGLWSLFVNVRCDDGSQTSYPLTLVGSAVPVQMTVNTPIATYAPTPIIYSNGVNGDHYITNLKFGVIATGLTVKYQLQNRGVAYNPAGWTALVEAPAASGIYGTVPNFKSGQKTLYAYSHIGGSTDSAVVSWNL